MTMAATDPTFFSPRQLQYDVHADRRSPHIRHETVADLKKFKGENKNPFQDVVIDVAIQRAEAEQAYYQGQFDAMVADNTDMNDGVEGVQSFASHYSTYTAAETTRDNAGVTLETAFEAREAATSAVAAAFTNSQAFYQQLVDRREFTKAAAEAEVTRLAGLTGDDAATDAETTAAATAVTTAQTALDTATEAQAAFQDLVAEGSPVADLVNELLKSDAAGDDGGALVDAIVGAYDGQDDAAERLDELLTETTTSIPQLDADGNAVTNADGIPQRTEVVTESGRIVDIEESIAGLTGEGGAVAMNTAAIVHERDRSIETNATGIATNATGIATNATGIATNVTDIATNRTMIGDQHRQYRSQLHEPSWPTKPPSGWKEGASIRTCWTSRRTRVAS